MTWATLRFPREVTPTQGLAALLALSGSSTPQRRDALVYEVVGSSEGIVHRLRVPEARSAGLWRQLQTAVPGLAIDVIDEPVLYANRAWRVWQSNRQRSLDTDHAEIVAHSLLTALTYLERGEAGAIQWTLGPVVRPRSVANQTTASFSGNPLAILGKAALAGPGDLDSDAVRALRMKSALPGWEAVLRIGVTARTLARQRQLLGGLASAARLAQGPGVQVGFDGINPRLLNERRTPLRWRVSINVGEQLGLS
jgi:hypothetical protein